MPRHTKVLIFCDYFIPGFKGGGPVTTLRNLLVRLGDRIDFYVVTRDRDLGDERSYGDVKTGVWLPITGGQVLYLRESQASVARFRDLIAEIAPQTVYLNSTLSRRFSLFPLLAARFSSPRPHIILAPRGEFSDGALALKPLRKRLYLTALRAGGLWRGVEWQASSSFEAADIRAVAGRTEEVTIAQDLPGALPELAPRRPKRSGRAEIVFLGRISPMKNLDGAIGVLQGLIGEVDFRVYGPIEDGPYWERCLKLADLLPRSVRFRHMGQIAPDAVPAILGGADVLLLPSHGENFGHVVAEALGAGCPVILSDRTPWRDLQALGVGWDLPLDQPESFTAALQHIVDMGNNEHATYRDASRAHAGLITDDIALLESNLALFQRQ
ncbi:glycosyltransferase involved in cell wall biosynthesis [Devosia sp. UYZn731]|uniref:glycosyltransferase family 4 protein n=1 Tax=Devosia sp. UYZn731 TaxID=3156345 RepID=UPI003397574E